MSNKEKLLEQFGCAINAVLGDLAEEDFDSEENTITKGDIKLIAQKVIFYMDLD